MDLVDAFHVFVRATGFAQLAPGDVLMFLISCILLYLAIGKGFEPLLLLPIGFGLLLSNLPGTGIFGEGGLIYYFHFGIKKGIFPSLIFMGVGALTDFGPLLANPKTILLGAAAQVGIFATLLGASSWASPFPRPERSGSSAGRTVPRPFIRPRNSPLNCSGPSPSRPTATWRSCPSSSRPSCAPSRPKKSACAL